MRPSARHAVASTSALAARPAPPTTAGLAARPSRRRWPNRLRPRRRPRRRPPATCSLRAKTSKPGIAEGPGPAPRSYADAGPSERKAPPPKAPGHGAKTVLRALKDLLARGL